MIDLKIFDGHTPGPWKMNVAGSAKAGQQFSVTEVYVYAPDTQDDTAVCADVIDPVTQDPSAANGRLIAAAPDLLAEVIRLRAEVAAMAADAGRYRWLRAQHWSTSPLCVAYDPKESVRWGYYCPAAELLDGEIDNALKRAAT